MLSILKMLASTRAILLVLAVVLISGVANGSTNCNVGSDCTCNFQHVNLNPPNQPIDDVKVCCPPTDGVTCSRYFLAGSANGTESAHCFCLFSRFRGNCLRGSQCTGKTATVFHNEMPLCCSKSNEKITSIEKVTGTNDLNCQCTDPSVGWTGNCWRGSQCNNCFPNHVKTSYNYRLCCPDCQRKKVTVNSAEKTCYCSS